MPKTKISEFSATPGNNTDIDGINISEGCAPSGINDAIRELMAQLKDFQAGTAGDSFNGPIGTTTPAAGVFTNLSASGTFALTGDQVQISEGGTGQTTANAAFNALAPSQSTHAGKYLKTDGTNTSWDAIDINTADITGTLPIANGGTGLTALGTGVQTALGQNVTGSGGIVLASSPSLTTPNLGTPSAVTLTNATGLPLSTGVTGTLATTNGGTGLTSFTANGVVYASSSSALTTGSALSFDGTNFAVGGSASSYAGYGTASVNGTTGGIFDAKVNGVRVGSFFAETGSATIATATNVPLVFNIFNAEQMRLTSTGLGIGTSSPASKLHIESASAESFRIGYSSTKTSRLGTTSAGDLQVFAYDSAVGYKNILLAVDAGTSAGNVGIGTSSPVAKLDTNGTIRSIGIGVPASGSGAEISWDGTDGNFIAYNRTGSAWLPAQFLGSTAKLIAQTSDATVGTVGLNNVLLKTNNTERARITSDGNLLVGTTSAPAVANIESFAFERSGGRVICNGKNADTVIDVNQTFDDTDARSAIRFFRNETQVGSISVSTSATAYNTSSDYRLKDNPQPLTNSGAFIDALQPKTWEWKADGSRGVGFIAHEVQAVSPTSVVGEKDAVDADGNPVMQAMEYGSAEFIANIIAELQSLRARVAQLEGASA